MIKTFETDRYIMFYKLDCFSFSCGNLTLVHINNVTKMKQNHKHLIHIMF